MVFEPVRDQYVEFAAHADDSPCFVEWATGIADDAEVLAWIAALPPIKQQPNLVFAAARWHGVPAPGPYAGLRDALLSDGDEGPIRATILERLTQTNEVGRLATLVPFFSALAGGQPIALLEVGASAGLNLFPDRWSYAWDLGQGTVVEGGSGAGPLTCAVSGPADASLPVPVEPPEIAWRGGIDLHALDVTDSDAMAWLTTLVWPEDDERRARLLEAIEVARVDPPALVTGDLLTGLPALVEQAAAYAPVVVFHSAVIAYVEQPDRERFASMMAGLVADGACHWISNESPRVLPDVAAGLGDAGGRFVIGVDGQAVGLAHGHGRSLEALPSAT